MRRRKEKFDIWHPAESTGEIGAAIVPCVLGITLAATRKRYSLGKNILCHFSTGTGSCAALIISTV
jgi:3-oxoacyl-[acyl-carrier-protein] synthase-1